MGSATLLSAVRWALGGRQRQFTTRDHLAELQRNAVQQQLMTRELAHRVKNTISVLQSIVTQTMRPYPATADLRDLLVERFAALARAQVTEPVVVGGPERGLAVTHEVKGSHGRDSGGGARAAVSRP